MSTSSKQSGEVFDEEGDIHLEKLKRLKCVYEQANWSIQALRCGFLSQLDNLIRNWAGRLPNLRYIFRNEEMNYFLEYYLKSCGDIDIAQGNRFINFLVRSGYKYEPGVDKGGNLLHIAVERGYKDWMVWLLRIGTDPNWVNRDGETVLHIIIHSSQEGFLKEFFKIIDDEQLTFQIDAKDNLGQTALQWAVAHLAPRSVGILLDHGADMSNFVFPTSSYFGQNFRHLINSPGIIMIEKLGIESWEISKLAFDILAVVQQLETKKYELNPSDAMTIMTFLSDLKLFEKSVAGQNYWYDKEEFDSKTKDLMVKSDLSLHDLVQLSPKQAAKLLTYNDYNKFVWSEKFMELPKRSKKAYIVYIYEMILRRFFLPWALDPFMELIHNRLPMLCCDMIIENLGNEDLYNICLAAASKSS